MTVLKNELRQGRLSFIIWTSAISFMMAACVLIYPQMGDQMEEMSAMFADMGAFSAAFGMDRLNFGEFLGFFGIECGNVLGIGGALFAALLGVTSLAKEEKEHTAEFLLTHPITRTRIVSEKLASGAAEIVCMNLAVVVVSLISIFAVDVSFDGLTLFLMFAAYFIMQLEIFAVTFAISAFIRGSGIGIGLGLAAVFYFVNIFANLMDETRFLKFFTPFGYTDSADIISDKAINTAYLAAGALVGIACITAAYIRYNKKDIS